MLGRQIEPADGEICRVLSECGRESPGQVVSPPVGEQKAGNSLYIDVLPTHHAEGGAAGL